jgi:hypothetical protein
MEVVLLFPPKSRNVFELYCVTTQNTTLIRKTYILDHFVYCLGNNSNGISPFVLEYKAFAK